MTRALLLAAALVALGGCNNKIRKYANNIDNMAVSGVNQAGPPQVSLGRMAAPTEDAAAQGAAAAGNVVIEVFEVEMVTRLSQLVSPTDLTEASTTAVGNAMDKNGPYPVDESSRWQFQVGVTGFGVQGDIDDPAHAWISLDASAYGPKGKRIWRRSLHCQQDLAAYMASATGVTQTALNIGMIRAMSDEDLLGVYDQLARQCGRDAAAKLNRTIQKAKAKGS
ncbi:MAG: hypothetical protein H6739_25080 [Alphaproteobacteria bacterium]|nr:hypothetical protein [Alphaproteobacteria bacterium]